MPQGIPVFENAEAPRLPLNGLRAIVANKLVLGIDGDRRPKSLIVTPRFFIRAPDETMTPLGSHQGDRSS